MLDARTGCTVKVLSAGAQQLAAAAFAYAVAHRLSTQDNGSAVTRTTLIVSAGVRELEGDKGSFRDAAQRQVDLFSVKGRLQAPVSPYELKSGAVTPCGLITAINSDLPGSITCQVRENVYDTVTGNHVLLPKGTGAVGEYNSVVDFGQDRVLAV